MGLAVQQLIHTLKPVVTAGVYSTASTLVVAKVAVHSWPSVISSHSLADKQANKYSSLVHAL